jgi:hypothetical protein
MPSVKMYLPPAGRSRRGFVKKGLFGGALLAIGGGLGFLGARNPVLVPLPREGLMTFDHLEYSVIHAIALRMIPYRTGFPAVEEVRVAFNADRVLQRADEGSRTELKRLIHLLENGVTNLLFGGRPEAFTRLSPEAQDQVLRDWQNSRLEVRRTGFQALRTLVLAAYYASPLSWKAVGYGGPPPGFHQKDAPVWKGGGVPRPAGNGVFAEGSE